jgi:mannose-1-phosphate guanylyltransferase/phosphomannomutase
MKAVVMAGGEGARLRPLTSGRPKPLVPVVGRPVAEHILRLLRNHGITQVVLTLQYLGSHIRDYFGDGSDLGMDLTYVVEDRPLGTAGSVKNAAVHLTEPFLVISGDALTDIDLTAAIAAHQARQHALATIVLYPVSNPLEYGVVITNPDGSVARFLEKPSWGEVFSDQVNTGIYVLDPAILDLIEPDRAVDWSADVFPKLLKRKNALFGHLVGGYWCDIGNIQSYFQANWDALAGKVNLEFGGRREGDVWRGDDIEIGHDVRLEGPIFLGNECKIKAGAFLNGPVVVGKSSVIDEGTKVSNSIIWSSSYIGEHSRLRQTIVCQHVTIKNRCLCEEGAVVGDNVVVGEGSTVGAGVKIWPDKEIEPGSRVNESIIWAGQWRRGLFRSSGLVGLVNVELTPEYCARLGASYAAIFPKGVAIAAGRDAHRSSRMIKRAIVSGLLSGGANITDLSACPIPVTQYFTRHSGTDGAIHVQMSPLDARSADIRLFDRDGVVIDKTVERKLENLFFREDIRRVQFYEMGTISYPRDQLEGYLNGVLAQVDTEVVRKSGLKVLIDYDYGSASLVLPRIFNELNVETIPLNAGFDETYLPRSQEQFENQRRQAALITKTLQADLGAYVDYGGERIFLIDERGELLSHHEALAILAMLMLGLFPGALVAPATVPRALERIAAERASRFVPSKSDPAALLRTAQIQQAVLASDGKGGYVFPSHHLAFDGMFTLIKLLELRARDGRPLSALRALIPPGAYEERVELCPWESKGRVMRMMLEMHRDRRVDLADGIKVFVDGGWVLVVPDPDAPNYHIVASVDQPGLAVELADRYAALVQSVRGETPGSPPGEEGA